MPIRKFESLEACDESSWRSPDDPDLWKAIAAIWRFSRRVAPQHFVPGVYKRRSIEESSEVGMVPPVSGQQRDAAGPLSQRPAPDR